MLGGDDSYVKIDKMMIRFLNNSIGYIPDKDNIFKLIKDSVNILKNKYKNLNPRYLDHLIWLYQHMK